jgi:hypothetical protein
MHKAINIKYLDGCSKLTTIQAFKKYFNLNLVECLGWVTQLIDEKEFDLSDESYLKSQFNMHPESVGRGLEEIFSCKIIDDYKISNDERWNPKISPETELAIKWYDNLSLLDQLNVDLLIKHRQIGPACG